MEEPSFIRSSPFFCVSHDEAREPRPPRLGQWRSEGASQEFARLRAGYRSQTGADQASGKQD